jgi:hypothetical protein
VNVATGDAIMGGWKRMENCHKMSKLCGCVHVCYTAHVLIVTSFIMAIIQLLSFE